VVKDMERLRTVHASCEAALALSLTQGTYSLPLLYRSAAVCAAVHYCTVLISTAQRLVLTCKQHERVRLCCLAACRVARSIHLLWLHCTMSHSSTELTAAFAMHRTCATRSIGDMSFPAAAGGRHFATRFHNLQIAEDDDNCSNSSNSSSSSSNSGRSGSSNSSVSDDVSQWSEGQAGVSSDDASSGHDVDDVSVLTLLSLTQ
jgi:hypothetical protein